MYQWLPAPPLKPSNHLFSSPCSKPQPENDVFLNFRGEDTRNNFTDHLYRALKRERIKTFKDDTNLELGHPISPNLLDAIEKSRIAVVILSKNYGSSRSCLEELVKILECKEEGGLTVLPIFFHVDPDHVQNQRETFAVAFAEHENRFQKKQVQIWRNALSDVAELAGKTLTNGLEGEFIEEIVDWIFTELKGKRSIVYEDGFVGIASQQEDGFFGIASRVKKMNSFLDMNSNDVHFIGICGKSGMGKTTLARFVFDKIRNQFEACSFLENVKEVSKAHGLETLQEQLLCDISKGALRVRDVSRGIQVIKNILRDKKVLIVVDDASEKGHLLALARKSWFGPRSRIIVTTEDECLLRSYEIQTVYKADGLNNVEAQLLFSHKAHCEIDFLGLGYDFVTYAQGSPLVLKVLGSHLCKRKQEEWETAWNRLKEILNEDISEKLRIAYNGLEELEKKLFLHIACFFKGEDQNRVAAILESVCYSNDKIRKLIDKSLITIEGGKLCMHHLIQQMGWKIVCGESKDLGRRSRLWDCEDVLYVLKENIGTERIEGMVLNLPLDKEQEELKAEPFSNMNKLKLLKICKLHLPCLHNLSNELLLLEWHEYPLKLLPKSFQPPELVELIMHRSGITQLPSEFRNLPKLKLIDLSDSQDLCRTPDFNELPNIERLIFQGCTGLHALDPSVGSLKRLILLNLKDCKCLEDLPHEINLESLKILILSGCSKLKKFPKIGRNMTSMLELYLDRTAIEELPSSIKHLTGLTLLNLQDCKNLSSLPRVICNLISLKILILSGCNGQPQKARYLSRLSSTKIGTVLTLPYTYLTDRQPDKETISLMLPKSFSQLSSLESLDLSGCNLLDGALPDDLSYLSSLTSLNLRNNNFICLPYSISQLLNLKLLFLDHCSKLQSLPYLPLSTQFVSAQGCTSLENYSNQVVVWTSDAARFTFINCHDLADDEEGKIADVPLLNTHFQSLWQRYMEDQIHQLNGFCLVVPQTEISGWFNNKECGSSVRIPLLPNLFNNRSWKGIALCVIFVVPPNLKDVSPGQDSKYFHEFICHFDMNGISLNCPLVLKVPRETFVGSFGLWLYISHARFIEHSDEGSCIGSVIRPTRLDIQIKMCGARVLYEQDMKEFVQNSRQENFRSCNDLSRGYEKFIEDHMSSSQCSDPKLKQKLNSLLSTFYQVGWAQNHLYDYIFHQIARPPHWFACKKLGPSIEKQLPPDVHDNSKWLGFTIYALYGIQMQPVGFSYKLDLTIFLRSTDEVSLAPYTVFPFSGDVSDKSPQDSQRLVVFYIPRRVFQLNQCNHIGASFKSGDTAVQFESCGIRLVHEQNVVEFVQALVEYMLGSPDSNHQSFYEHLSHELGMLQVCNHEEDYPCPFLPERRPNPMRMLLRNYETIQEESTSRETFSNQVIAAGTSKNSSPGSINLGISFGNGQCGSKMSGSRECRFKPCLQNHHKCSSAFNRCSPQSEIPKWFTEQNTRSSMTISLPLNLYNKPDWIGFAISAVFSSHKNPTTARMKQGSGFSHVVICHLKTDLGCMNPLLYYGIREEHVLTLLHQREFLWESIISHRLLSPEWRECTWVEFSFVSDSSDVSALKCAVNLVYLDNLENFTLTMAPCITSYNNPFTSNERSPFYLRDKSNDSDGLYEDQTNGTSGQYSYGGQHPRYQLYQTAVSDFFPSTPYNCCFPPSKIQDWFSHQNHGCSATMDLPSNLYHNSNWKGLVLYASFSIQGDSNFILSNLNSGKSHSLYCQCQMSMANVDDQTIAFSTSKEEITWLLELGEFIWISYVPGEPFKNMLQHCSRIEASFVSDWPGVIVQKCALQLLYRHDQIQFEQELKYCNNLISENRELVRKQQEDQKKRNEQYHADEGHQRKIFSNFDFEVKLFPRVIDQSETDETETELGQSDLLVVVEDEPKDNRSKLCAEDGESKITEQTSTKNTTIDNNNRESSSDTSKENSKASKVQKPDYIHVQARRGQATDSHNLAERVRREKISERMKFPQDLVPGCNKITGKAVMLDENINYAQSLQRQLEFLSMKLAAVNPRLDSNIEDLFGKESIGITDLKARLEKVREAKENAMNQSRTPKIQKVIFLLREPVDNFRKYYEPEVVSLGPIHHGNPKYQLGENYKLLLTSEFIEGSGKNLEDVYNMIKEKIYELRTCFEEEVIEKYDDEALTWILLVDGCAILQYIYCATNNKFKELKIKTDSVAFGQQDLFLLENQLPYRLLTWLMSLSVKEKELRESIETYIGSHVKVPEDQQSNWLSWRLSQRSKPQQAQSAKEESHHEENPHVQDHTTSVAQAPEPVHLLDHLRTRMLHGPEYIPDGTVGKINQNKQNIQGHWQYRNVQELKTAGIHLKRGNDCYLSKIKFTKQFIFRGQLHLPPIVVDDSTRPKFLNLMAYEMCLDFKNDFGVSSYISFLYSLIAEANDVKMLRKARILHNVLGSDEEVAKLFFEIGSDLAPDMEIYKDVTSEIQKHCESKWMTWIAQVFHDQFSSPWKFIAFIGALLTLALTITQTWYAVNSPPRP